MTCVIFKLLLGLICCYHESLGYRTKTISVPFYRRHKLQYAKKDDVESITNNARRDVVSGISVVSQIALILTTSAASISYASNVGKPAMIDQTMPIDWNKRLRSGNSQMLPRGSIIIVQYLQ